MDPTTIVAFAINGEPLPQRHGYPARVVVPGLLRREEREVGDPHRGRRLRRQGVLREQGWGPNFVIPTRSDIFGPRWVRHRR